MPSYKDQFPDRWLNAEHLQGKNVPVTISQVTLVETFNTLTNQKERKLAASFQGKELKLLINKTNAQALESITGTDQYDQWRGARVVLRPDRAPNGKPTIRIGPFQESRAQSAQPAAAPAPVHGRMENQVHGPVHGRMEDQVHGRTAEDEIVDGQMEMFGLGYGDLNDEEEDFGGPALHGLEESEESAVADPKSADPDQRPSATDEIFFSITDLTRKVRDLHAQSSEPMTVEQHDYIVRSLTDFGGKDGLITLRLITGRDETSRDNRAGSQVGRYLYELMRPQGALPEETAALRHYCESYVPKTKKQSA